MMHYKPKGISFEIGCSDIKGFKKWWFELSDLKLKHMRPTLDNVSAKYGGFKLDIPIGEIKRPMPRFWDPRYYKTKYMEQEPFTNPWNSGHHWFVLTLKTWQRLLIPFLFFFFMRYAALTIQSFVDVILINLILVGLKYIGSVSLFMFLNLFIFIAYGSGERQPGFYFGVKTYEVDGISQGLGRYGFGNPETLLIKEPYPETVAWGSAELQGSIYLCPSFSIRLSDMVD